MRAVRHGFRAVAPDIYAGEQEQPHHVDEMPVPGGEFEAEMLLRIEMTGHGADQTNDQEDGADDDMGTVEASRHEESSAVDIAFETEGGVRIFIGLHAGKRQAEQ